MQSNRNSVMSPLPDWLTVSAEGFLIDVHVQPGARRTVVVGPHGHRLKLAVQAPPLEGRANDAVIGLLAECLGVRPSSVRVVGGQGSRDKRIHVERGPLAAAEVVRRLQPK